MNRWSLRMGPGVAFLCLAYIAGWALSPLVAGSTLNDLDLYFWPSAQIGAHGHPLMAYSVQTFDGYPNANGPLGLLVLVPLAAIANLFGWSGDVRVHAGMVGAVAALVALLLARDVVRIVQSVRGRLEWQLAGPCVILLTPILWMSIAEFGHLEQLIELYFMVLAVRLFLRGSCSLAGGAVGMALLSRTTAVLFLVPFLLLLLTTRRFRRPVLKLVATALLTFGVGISPFLIADGRDVIHSLVTFRGGLPIGGGSVLLAFRTGGDPVLRHIDALLMLIVSVAVCGTVLRLRPALASTAVGISGLLCIAAVCFPMLAKTVYPYYLLEPYVFAVVWWLARRDSALSWRAVVPMLLIVDAFLANWGTHLPLAGIGVVEGVMSSLVLAAVIGMVVADLLGLRSVSEGRALERATAVQ